MQTIKCVTIGEGSVGKTCLLISYVIGQQYSPDDYVPTVFDNFSSMLEFNGRKILLELWDTAGQESYDRLRPLSYTGTNVFLVCFSIESRHSFENVEKKWVREVKHFCKDAQIILIGTKKDLRFDPETLRQLKMNMERPVSYSEGCSLAKRIGAFRYVECSSMTCVGVSDVFEAAVESILGSKTRKVERRWCSLL